MIAGMTRRLPVLVLVSLLAGVAWGAPAEEARARAQDLVHKASQLASRKQYDEALRLLAQAQEADPTFDETQSWLAHVYELKGDKSQALTHVAALLALSPTSRYGKEAVHRLFYTPPFPRLLTPATRTISPLSFTADVCTLGDDRMPAAPAQVALCYTTSTKYPDDAPPQGAVVERILPVPGDKPLTERFNRVVYGYLETPDTGDFRLRVIAYYPSPLLSGSDRDLSPIAQALVHLVLRCQCYAEEVLGLPPQGDAEGINRVWLCLGGPPGAQRSDSDLFLYRVLTDQRTPMEWVRQLVHECGHLVIPRIGGFAEPEMWGNGALGERLFIYFLTGEAGRVAGTGWPSDAASARLDRLWPGGHLAAEQYLATPGRAPLAIWAANGPASELIVGQTEQAMQYYVGLNLYLLAAHGPAALREVVKQCAGTSVADFVYTYKQAVIRWAEAGSLALRPGCFDPTTAKLTSPPPGADLSPASVTLSAGDSVTYPVFLPTGQWQLALRLAAETSGKLAVSFDGGAEVQVEVGAGAKPVLIGPLTETWHKLTLRAPIGQGPWRLLELRFQQPGKV